MLRVFLTHNREDLDAYYRDARLALEQIVEIVANPFEHDLSTPELIDAAAGCQVIVAHRSTPGEATLFEGSPSLLAFLRAAVDLSTVDVEAASRAGVAVGHAEKTFVAATAEMALALMLDVGRHVSRSTVEYRTGNAPPQRVGVQLRGSTVGIIGHGAIGSYLAEAAAHLGMAVLVTDPHVDIGPSRNRQVPLDELLAESDFVLPLAESTDETRHLIGTPELAAMKPGAILINVSRGELVDEAAVERALESGQLGGFGMDVGSAADQRPNRRLAARADVVATPHLGGLTPQAAFGQAANTVQQVEAIAARRMPERIVNSEDASRLTAYLSASG